ncbi:MAG TPA: hypothetical protein VKE22_25505 [Haliangiales bacterium]|nr:hypothetical protein [Haliangiales bacterium]
MRTYAWLALLCACDAGFADPNIVVDLRVLAIRTDPAEVVVDFDPANPTNVTFPTVTVTALVIDPAGPRHSYRFTACPKQRNLRCDGEVLPHLIFGEGVAEAGQETIVASLDVTLDLLKGAIREDPFGGFGGVPVNLELRVVAEGGGESAAVYGGKQMVYAPRVPPSRTPNQNPSFQDLTLDGEPVEGCPVVEPGREVKLEPIEPAGVREDYVVPTLDGGQRMFTENLRYAWLATAGEFSSGNTGGPVDFFGNKPPLWTKWTAPDADTRVRLWIVQRDERGGTFWTERCLQVQKPPG